jgi:hypothetical protein
MRVTSSAAPNCTTATPCHCRRAFATLTRLGFAALRLLGLRLPERTHVGHILGALLRLKITMRGRSIETLPDMPPCAGAQQRQILDIIDHIGHATYFHDTNAFILMALTAARLVLQNGNVLASGYFFAIVAAVFCTLNDGVTGRKWMEASRRFAHAQDPPHTDAGKRLCVQLAIVDYALLSPHELVSRYREASRLSMEFGDVNYATMAAALATGRASLWSLDEIQDLLDTYRDISQRSHEATLQARVQLQYLRMVRGETRGQTASGMQPATNPSSNPPRAVTTSRR